MRTNKIVLTLLIFGFSFAIYAQEKDSKVSYYQARAEEDAKFEQQFKAEDKEDEEKFWKEQKRYEKDLKKKDKVAYNAYMEGKRDAYREHYGHCDHHCHHSDHYYSHATFYYYGYHDHYYYRRPASSGISTNVRIGTPTVRLGLF